MKFNFTENSSTTDIPTFEMNHLGIGNNSLYQVVMVRGNDRIGPILHAFRFKDVAEGCCKRLALEVMDDWEAATGRDLGFEHEQRGLRWVRVSEQADTGAVIMGSYMC